MTVEAAAACADNGGGEDQSELNTRSEERRV